MKRSIKKQFDKEDGIVAYHGYQSFAEGEVTPEQAHEIGIELARRFWGDGYQVIVATHLNTSQEHSLPSWQSAQPSPTLLTEIR